MGGLPRTKMSGGDMNRTNKNRILEMKILKPTRYMCRGGRRGRGGRAGGKTANRDL